MQVAQMPARIVLSNVRRNDRQSIRQQIEWRKPSYAEGRIC